MQEWNGRLKIELSAAIKSPCIQYQLMGSKKVQQELARPGALEKFIASKQTVCMLRALFADQYSLDLVSKHFHFFFSEEYLESDLNIVDVIIPRYKGLQKI